jgi:hypothetical protein
MFIKTAITVTLIALTTNALYVTKKGVTKEHMKEV